MHRISIIGIILIGACLNVNAQFEERFCFPKKEVAYPDSLNIEEFPLYVEKDSIFIQYLKPLVSPKQFTVLYFQGAGGNSSTYISTILIIQLSAMEHRWAPKLQLD